MDINKLNANKVSLCLQPMDLKATMRGVMKMNEKNAYDKGIFLKLIMNKVSLPEYVDADKARIVQVLMNLIGNSIKFTQSGGVFIKVDWFPSFEEISIGEDDGLLLDNFLATSELENIVNSEEEIIYSSNISNLQIESENSELCTSQIMGSFDSIGAQKIEDEETKRRKFKQKSLVLGNAATAKNGYLKIQIIDTGMFK